MVICLTLEYFLTSYLCWALREIFRLRSLYFAVINFLLLESPWGFDFSRPPAADRLETDSLLLLGVDGYSFSSVALFFYSRQRLYSHKSSASIRGWRASIWLSISIAKPTSSTLNDKLWGVWRYEQRSWRILRLWRKIWGLCRIIFTIMNTIYSFLCGIWVKLNAGKCSSL